MNKVTFYSEEKKGTKVYEVPENFNELSQSQLTKIMNVIHSRISQDEANIQVLSILLKFDSRPKLFRKLLNGLQDGIQDLFLLTEFIFQESTLTKSPFPLIKMPIKAHSIWLHGPMDYKLLRYMTFLEWVKSETYFNQYLENYTNEVKRIEILDKLLAVFYRAKGPGGKAGDVREPYNDYTVDKRAADIHFIDNGIKYAFFYHFHAHRLSWSKTFRNVYTTSHSELNSESETRTTDLPLFKMMLKLAGGSKDMDQLGSTEASIVLLELDEKIKESKENESSGSN